MYSVCVCFQPSCLPLQLFDTGCETFSTYFVTITCLLYTNMELLCVNAVGNCLVNVSIVFVHSVVYGFLVCVLGIA